MTTDTLIKELETEAIRLFAKTVLPFELKGRFSRQTKLLKREEQAINHHFVFLRSEFYREHIGWLAQIGRYKQALPLLHYLNEEDQKKAFAEIGFNLACRGEFETAEALMHNHSLRPDEQFREHIRQNRHSNHLIQQGLIRHFVFDDTIGAWRDLKKAGFRRQEEPWRRRAWYIPHIIDRLLEKGHIEEARMLGYQINDRDIDDNAVIAHFRRGEFDAGRILFKKTERDFKDVVRYFADKDDFEHAIEFFMLGTTPTLRADYLVTFVKLFHCNLIDAAYSFAFSVLDELALAPEKEKTIRTTLKKCYISVLCCCGRKDDALAETQNDPELLEVFNKTENKSNSKKYSKVDDIRNEPDEYKRREPVKKIIPQLLEQGDFETAIELCYLVEKDEYRWKIEPLIAHYLVLHKPDRLLTFLEGRLYSYGLITACFAWAWLEGKNHEAEMLLEYIANKQGEDNAYIKCLLLMHRFEEADRLIENLFAEEGSVQKSIILLRALRYIAEGAYEKAWHCCRFMGDEPLRIELRRKIITLIAWARGETGCTFFESHTISSPWNLYFLYEQHEIDAAFKRYVPELDFSGINWKHTFSMSPVKKEIL